MKKLLLTIAIILMATATSWATIVSDDGSGADANPIGGSWSTVTGDNAVKRQNNRFVGSTNYCACLWNANTFTANQFSMGKCASRKRYLSVSVAAI